MTGEGTLTHSYVPRGSAVELFHSRGPETVLSGPAGTGKSRACLEKLLLQALKYPGMRGLILRKTQVSLGSSALKTWREDVATELLANGTISFYGGSAEHPPQYRLSNGSTIFVGGLDRATRIMSTEYDVIYIQEATEVTQDDWQHVLTRLRNGRMPYQQVYADCNPDSPDHWLKTRCDSGATRMIHCKHEDNPVLYDVVDGEHVLTKRGAHYMALLDSLTGVRYLRLRRGQWVAAEGIIYDEFSAATHVIDEMPTGWQDWPRYWSVDFGFIHPFVCSMWAQDPDGRLYLYREIYMTGRTVDRHARDILDAVTTTRGGHRTWLEPQPQLIVADHDAENRARFELELGIGTTAANKAVRDGIDLVKQRLALAGDGRPRIYFLRNAVIERDSSLADRGAPCSTLEEFGSYVWLRPTASGVAKEGPVKVRDDGMDAMRYICKELDDLVRPNIRFL